MFTVNQKRPVNLDLATLKYPPMAIVSILHRLSGIALFLLLPLILYYLSLSLHNEQSYIDLQQLFTQPLHKLLLWIFGAALIYHMLAGIRHLIMDLGYGEGLESGRRSAIFVIAVAAILTILLGIWIW